MNRFTFVFIALTILATCDSLFAKQATKKATSKYYLSTKAKSSKATPKESSKGQASPKVGYISTKSPRVSKGKGSTEDSKNYKSFSTKAPTEKKFSSYKGPSASNIPTKLPDHGKGSIKMVVGYGKGNSIAIDEDPTAIDAYWVNGVQGSLFSSSSSQVDRSMNAYMVVTFFVLLLI